MQLFFWGLNEREKFEIESRAETKHLNGYDWTPFILSTPQFIISPLSVSARREAKAKATD